MFCLAQESQFLEVKVKDSWHDLKGLVNHNQRPIKTLPAQKEAPHWMTHKIRSCASHSVILIDWCWLKIVIFIVNLLLSVYFYLFVYVSTLSIQFVWCLLWMYIYVRINIKKICYIYIHVYEYFETMLVVFYVYICIIFSKWFSWF